MRSFSFVLLAASSTFVSAIPFSRRTNWLQQNGPAAKALNDQYASLTASSPCNSDWDTACIDGQFAHCLNGEYFIDGCESGWTCAAIPNEWSSGTTTTCDTSDNITWRFSQAGISETKRSTPVARSISQLQANGPAAKALNDQYASLTASSPCNSDWDTACIDGQFAHCLDGKYFIDGCESGWTCAAIPNEWSSGTTTTCDTSDNIAWRFSQAGISETKRSA